jgi:hypothetical protein
MTARLVILCLCGASALASPARAQEEASQASSQTAAPIADRLTLSANGSTLSAASGGGASIGWLRSLRSEAMIGAGIEHQSVADTRWTFGSVHGAFTRKSPAGRNINLHAEIYRGSGEEAERAFSYSVTAAGVTGAVTDRLSLRFETSEIDIDRTNGNLLELGSSFLWNPRFLTDVAYARSVSGNLGTDLVSTRTDYYGARFRVLFGAAFGEAAPSVVNLLPGLSVPDGSSLRQVFGGVSKPLERGELLAVVDYLQLGGSKRATLTMSYTIPLRRQSRSNR